MAAKNGILLDTFILRKRWIVVHDFLINTCSSINNYISISTRTIFILYHLTLYVFHLPSKIFPFQKNKHPPCVLATLKTLNLSDWKWKKNDTRLLYKGSYEVKLNTRENAMINRMKKYVKWNVQCIRNNNNNYYELNNKNNNNVMAHIYFPPFFSSSCQISRVMIYNASTVSCLFKTFFFFYLKYFGY